MIWNSSHWAAAPYVLEWWLQWVRVWRPGAPQPGCSCGVTLARHLVIHRPRLLPISRAWFSGFPVSSGASWHLSRTLIITFFCWTQSDLVSSPGNQESCLMHMLRSRILPVIPHRIDATPGRSRDGVYRNRCSANSVNAHFLLRLKKKTFRIVFSISPTVDP